MVQFRKKYRRSWNLCNYFCLIESWIISYWRTEIRLYCVCSWSCFMRYQGVWVWTLIAIPGSQSVVRPFRFTYWLITDELGLHLNSLITNQWKRQQSQIMSVTPPGVLSVGSGWLVLSVLSVSGDGWWTRGQASWCHGPGPGPRHGPGQHRSQEARAQHHHHWVSAFCHHQRWWQPVLLHTLHRQHAGENSSLGLKLRGEHRRSSWHWIFQLINFTITKIKEVCVCVDMVCG